METWLGLDLGTSSVKALVAAETGAVVARGSADYGSTGTGRTHEQDAQDYLDAVRRAVAECARDTSLGKLAGVAVVGHTPSLVLARADGAPAHPVLTWRDARADAESALLEAEFGPSERIVGVANLWAPSHLPAKLLWLSRTRPDAVGSAAWILTPKDYVAFRLTGAAATDPWSAKGVWSVRDARRATEVLEFSGVPEALVPDAAPPWSELGTITTEGSAATGLPAGLPVAVGWSDALAGMLGIGAATHERSFILTGTSDIVGTSLAGAGAAPTGLYGVPEPITPVGVHYGPTQSSGASLLWLSRLLGRPVGELVGAAAGVADTEATFLPYLAGERAPLWDPQVRAGFSGVAEADGPDHLALAVLRGVASSGLHVLERSWPEGHAATEVHLGGSNVLDEGWIRARRDVLAADLVLHREAQLTALGAAMLARSAATGETIGRSQVALSDDVVRVRADPGRATRAQTLRARYLHDSALAVDRAQARERPRL
jgi:xylulokinase